MYRATKEELGEMIARMESYCHSPIIVSLFDFTGTWSRPWRENGYRVIQIDLELGLDIYDWDYTVLDNVYGIIAAPPCTDHTVSCNRHSAWICPDIF